MGVGVDVPETGGVLGGGQEEARESAPLLLPRPGQGQGHGHGPTLPPPGDAFHLAYAIYFTLGAGFLLPWNAFITAIDYFSYLYPAAPVDRVFAVAYMLCCLAFLVLMVGWWAHRSGASARINAGLVLFAISLLVVPVLDAAFVQGRCGLYGTYDATVAAVSLAGVADALVQGGVIGSAGELPERYMQAVVAGTAASATTFVGFVKSF